MLNASARSKAKLPISAMWDDPNVFFQKPYVQATADALCGDVCRNARRWAGEKGGGNPEQIGDPGDRVFPPEFSTSTGRFDLKIGGRGSAARRGFGQWALSALLAVALANLALRSQPVFGFVTRFKSAALGEQISETTDFVLHIDGNEIGAGFGFDDFRLSCGLLDLRLSGFGSGAGRRDLRQSDARL